MTFAVGTLIRSTFRRSLAPRLAQGRPGGAMKRMMWWRRSRSSPVVRTRVRPAKGTIEAGRVRRVALPCVSRSHQGVLRRRQAQGGRMQRLPRRHGDYLADMKKRPATKTDLATCGCVTRTSTSRTRRWIFTARHDSRRSRRPGPPPTPRTTFYDAARLHQGAQPAARPHVRAARPVHRRSRVRRRFAPKDSWRYSRRQAT